MPLSSRPFKLAALLSVAAHLLAIGWLLGLRPVPERPPVPPPPEPLIIVTVPPTPVPAPPDPTAPNAPATPAPRPAPAAAVSKPTETPAPPEPTPATGAPAFMEAPPAPTAEEWALAATYTLKNSKRYRHTWAQQVRSMMGTAVEGPDQGVVRFRIEIAPDGRLQRLETLWKTSDLAERLARNAVEAMPPLPPTPNGQPLVFEKTISFQPFAADGPPIYRDDCEPDLPAFGNPFAWDGRSPRPSGRREPPPPPPDAQALEDCRKQLPKDSFEAEQAHDQRQLDRWASPRLTEVPR